MSEISEEITSKKA